MNTTKVTLAIAVASRVSAARPNYSFGIVLALVALCSATAAWSWPQSNLPGPPVPSNMPGGVESGQSARVPPNMLNGLRPVQPGRARARRSAATPEIQPAAAIPPFGRYLFVNINVPKSTYVQPNGINNRGLVTGWYQDASYNTHGFVWQNGVVQTRDYPGATATYLNGTNNRDILIGYYVDASGTSHAVTYSVASSAWAMLPDIPDYPAIQPNGINDNGVAVGYANGFPFGQVAWIWHPDSQSYSFFTEPAAAESSTLPAAVNNKREVVGRFQTVPGNDHGFLREGCREADLEDTDENSAFRNIDVPGGFDTQPTGINNNGTIAGWFFDANFDEFGFVRTRGGAFTAVNYPGSGGTTQIDGINDHGALCGYFYTAADLSQGFVAYPQ